MVSIDVETTGRDAESDRIVEIACVLYQRGEIQGRHSWLINPQMPIPEEARNVHGISDDDVKDKPLFSEVMSDMLDKMSGAVPIAYNAAFDRAFLRAELVRAGTSRANLPPPAREDVEWIDPLVWARELQKEEKSKALTAVAERLGVSIEQAHRATDDAAAAALVLARFLEDPRVPTTYGAFVQEQRRLARAQQDERQFWQRG